MWKFCTVGLVCRHFLEAQSLAVSHTEPEAIGFVYLKGRPEGEAEGRQAKSREPASKDAAGMIWWEMGSLKIKWWQQGSGEEARVRKHSGGQVLLAQ